MPVSTQPGTGERPEGQCPVRQGGRAEGGIVEACGLLISRRVRQTIPPCWCPEIADTEHRANLPENKFNIALS
jgi:hypothetical protein